MLALLTGGTGFVGSHVARALRSRGIEVRGLVRAASDPTAIAALESMGVTCVEGDLRDRDAVRRAAAGVDAVYHCAADYRLWVPDPDTMHASNVEGTRNVLTAGVEAGASRLVHTSSVGALGLLPDGRPANEDTPVSLEDMSGPYKRTKFLSERVAEELAHAGAPIVIVNPSTPVGEGDLKPTATGQMIVDFLDGKMPAYVDTGLNLVDVRDVAEGHVLAAERGRIGEKYILGNRDMTLEEILGTLARLTGRPAPKIRLPHWVPYAAAAVGTAVARVTGKPPRVSLDAVRLARYRMFFDAAKAVHELGLPQTPVEDALARAVDWFEENGYVERPAP